MLLWEGLVWVDPGSCRGPRLGEMERTYWDPKCRSSGGPHQWKWWANNHFHHITFSSIITCLKLCVSCYITGYYLYIKSSSHSRMGDTAHLKSPLSPPTGPDGYCFTFWYHMFGTTVGSLRMSIYDISSNHITSVRLTQITLSWHFYGFF